MKRAVEKSGTGLSQGIFRQFPGIGASRANWVRVGERLPAQGQLVLIAYLFMGDHELTVDMGERDGDQWMYLGGGPIDHGEVLMWAFPPPCPGIEGVASGWQPRGLVELTA